MHVSVEWAYTLLYHGQAARTSCFRELHGAVRSAGTPRDPEYFHM